MRRLLLALCGAAVLVAMAPSLAAGSDVAPIGLISGSNGDRYWNEAVERYGLPSVQLSLGGGDLSRWGDPNGRHHDRYWSLFDEKTPDGPVDIFWLVLTRGRSWNEATVEAQASYVVEKVRELRPGSTIWAVAMPPYEPNTCPRALPESSAHAVAFAIETFEDVEAGPVFPPTTQTVDGCHPGGESLAEGAQIIADWAEGLGY